MKKMKIFILLVMIQCSGLITNAQTTHVINLDSTKYSDFSWPNDTTITLSSGDSIVILNQLAAMDFYIWLNDTTMTSGPQPTSVISTNAPIFYFTVVNDSTWSSPLGTLYNIDYFTIHAQTETFGGRFFFNYNSVGIKENSARSEFKVYPNPSNGNFQISVAEINHYQKDLIFEIIDFSGKRICDQSIMNFLTGTYEIDLTALPPGIYFLKIYVDNGYVQTLKIVKE